MPQPKKQASVRARSNRASTAATLTDGTRIIRPELPGRTDRDGDPVDWHPLTLEWWNDLWASPMAAEYHSSDRHALFILAALVDQFWTHPTKDLAGEIRLQRVPFGLTPYDRRRLEWTIETAEQAKDSGAARRNRAGAKQPSAKDDPRLTLVQ
jgi:hypothetical protein